MPTVSICMITYNHEEFIKKAIEGVLMQQCNFEFELIIANDSSQDQTDRVILDVLKNDSRAKRINYFHHKKNLGMMQNFCFALNHCKGKYIAFCDGDDFWIDKNKLQRQIDFLETNSSYVGCFHNVLALNQQNPNIKPKPWRVYNKDTFELIDTFSKTALFHTCSFVFRNEALDIPKWFNKVSSGDMALFSIVSHYGNLKLLEGNMSVYRKVLTGVTSNEKIKKYHKNRILLWQLLSEHSHPFLEPSVLQSQS